MNCKLFVGAVVATTLTGSGYSQVYVDTDVITPGGGDTWQTAFRHLQDALDATPAGQIWVAAGTYYPDRSSAAPMGTGSRDSSFVLQNDVAIFGGFLGFETDPTQRDLADPLAETILSGEIGDPADPADNSFHVVTAPDVEVTARLDGFTILAGRANMTGNDVGAGLLIDHHSDVVIANCHMTANVAGDRDASAQVSGAGGGIAVRFSPSGPVNGPFPGVRILDCVIDGTERPPCRLPGAAGDDRRRRIGAAIAAPARL